MAAVTVLFPVWRYGRPEFREPNFPFCALTTRIPPLTPQSCNLLTLTPTTDQFALMANGNCVPCLQNGNSHYYRGSSNR